MKEYKRKLPILNVKWSILLYENPSELEVRFPNVEFIPSGVNFQGGTFTIDDTFYLALLMDDKMNNGVIAHECNHLVNIIFNHIGYKTEPSNDEIHCYFLTYFVDKVDLVIQDGKWLKTSK